MKNLPRLVLALFFTLTALVAASAQSVEAKVIKVTGNATVQIAGRPEAAVVDGMSLPQGATVSTDAGGEVVLQTQQGTIATLKPGTRAELETLSVQTSGSRITKQSTTLNLRSGNIVATLDPSKKAVNDFKVRTPRGVAAARGTALNILLKGDNVTVAATADTVTFTDLATGVIYSVTAGMVTVATPGLPPAAPVSLAQAVAENPDLAVVASNAVASLAVAIERGIISSEGATNLAAQIVTVAAIASPDSAASAASTIAAAVTNSSSAEIQAGAGTTVAAVAASAVQAAPGQATSIAASVAAAAPAQSGAVVAAVSLVSPDNTASITQAVAAATNQSVQQVTQASTAASATASAAVNQAEAATQTITSTTSGGSSSQPSNTSPTVIDATTRSGSS